ncbi:FAD-dependent oxidoreductase [Calycomorphotria hydatis]|uniref:Fumarate reductase flavoprotein subunit n=1 Tax=Calycomorphotria hydatis TaxID=2528027 RepID=A0A517TDG2_9PLAN|nr:FAD-dependent oxidoreductase [Calycomorphotria hydatis]QDT66418.1 fumarate reductase flavoprotein subunit [Calycomorphotria hydatis]
MLKHLILIVSLLALSNVSVPRALAADFDVVVYGGTPGGIMAAISARREGASVVLLEQTKHVGGMSTSGLNRDEAEHMDRATFGGLYEQFTREAAIRSGTNPDPKGRPRIWQSRIAEEVLVEMLEAAGVVVKYDQLIDGVSKERTDITELRVRGGDVYGGKAFIDATYEGDLMAAAGVSCTVGREAKETYNESLGGVRYLDKPVNVSPYDAEGNLLPGIMPGEPPTEFQESPVPLCYNVRLNLTSDPDNMVPINKPEGYDPGDHELLARCIESGHIKTVGQVIALYGMPNTAKRECNNRQFSFVSMSIPGAQTEWSEAGFEEREAIHKQYRDYTHGILWFLKTDERVPTAMREEMAKYGFCKDEWTDNNHWPWYLYIRAGRRMKGAYVMTQADVTELREKEDVIHVGSHFIDSHHVARYAVDENHFVNEGRIWQKGVRFDIPYRAITPQAEECTNLLVPVSVSASSVAFCAIRLEPTWMHLGEAAGVAAMMAIRNDQPVQSVEVPQLQKRLSELGLPVKLPKLDKFGRWVTQFFDLADADRNGLISAKEWAIHKGDWVWLFDFIDNDNSGQIDRDEYRAFQAYKKSNPNWQSTIKAGK